MQNKLTVSRTLGELGLRSMAVRDFEMILTNHFPEFDEFLADFMMKSLVTLDKRGNEIAKKFIYYVGAKIGFHFAERILEHLGFDDYIKYLNVVETIVDASIIANLAMELHYLWNVSQEDVRAKRQLELAKGGEVKTHEHLF